MTQTINPNMILLARESRGLTQTDLAEKLNSYKANISGWNMEIPRRWGNPSLHFLRLPTIPCISFYRGKYCRWTWATANAKMYQPNSLHPIEAQMNIIRRHVQTVTRAMDQAVPELPLYKVDETNTPEKNCNTGKKEMEYTGRCCWEP